MTETTTIKITKKLAKELRTLGNMGDTYESVIWNLIEGDKE